MKSRMLRQYQGGICLSERASRPGQEDMPEEGQYQAHRNFRKRLGIIRWLILHCNLIRFRVFAARRRIDLVTTLCRRFSVQSWSKKCLSFQALRQLQDTTREHRASPTSYFSSILRDFPPTSRSKLAFDCPGGREQTRRDADASRAWTFGWMN